MAHDAQSQACVEFFQRLGFGEAEKQECYDLIEVHYPEQLASPASSQGYCSITFLVGEDIVIQFRPPVYSLDIRVAETARSIFRVLVPETKSITTLRSGLLVYQMSRIDGISLASYWKLNPCMESPESLQVRSHLIRQFAAFLSHSWHKGRAETLPLGLVGKSLIPRLKSLVTDLPCRFQGKARHILKNLPIIEALPWVLTHGDITASNIMVHSSTGHLTGFVDWAEAERLPFGTCLYGLEEILGEITSAGFRYHSDAEYLRRLFWRELVIGIPELKQAEVLNAVKVSRDLGVLLWYGIAFDEGVLDRVVQEGKDLEEIHRLDAFFGIGETKAAEASHELFNSELITA